MSSTGPEIIYYKPWVYFITVQSIGIILFLIGLVSNLVFYSKGKAVSLRNKKDYRTMLKVFVLEVLLQRQIFRQSLVRWLMHFLIFWGFLTLLTLSAVSVLLETVLNPNSSLAVYFTSGQGRLYYKALGESGGLMLLLGGVIAFVRRYIVSPKQVETIWTDTIALNALIILVLTGFTLEAMRISLLPPILEFRYSFIARPLSSLFIGVNNLKPYLTALWVFHGTLTAALVAYLPYSKLMHIFTTPAEVTINASEEQLRGDLYGKC